MCSQLALAPALLPNQTKTTVLTTELALRARPDVRIHSTNSNARFPIPCASADHESCLLDDKSSISNPNYSLPALDGLESRLALSRLAVSATHKIPPTSSPPPSPSEL